MAIQILETTLLPDDPEAAATACIEAGCNALLLDVDKIPPEFFDLSTRVLGNLLHRLGLYQVRLAGVVPDVQAHSGAFQDFVRESNVGNRFRFFPTRKDALIWLESLQED